MSFHPGLIAGSALVGGTGGEPEEPEQPGGIEPVSALYWRVRMPWANGSPYYLAEIEMRATEGGVDQCEGGTASAFSGASPSALFDNSTSTAWLSATSDGTDFGWVQYQFPAPVQVTEIAITAYSIAARTPRVVALQYSNDGVTWAEWAHWSGLTSWADHETKVLNAANREVIPAGSSPFWRIQIAANNGWANIEMAEIELRSAHGGASLPPTAGGNIISMRGDGSGNWGSTDAFFDGSAASAPANSASSTLGGWVGYLFPEPVSIVEAAVAIGSRGSAAPREFTFGYSNDCGLTWTTVHSATDQIAWAGWETRVFDLTQPTSRGVRGDWHLDLGSVPSGWVLSDLASAATNVSGGDNDPGFVVSDTSFGSLPRYFEVVIDARGAGAETGYVGIVEAAQRAFAQSSHMTARPNCIGYRETGEIRSSGGTLATEAPYGAGDVVMVAYDPTARTVQFGINGVWHATSHTFGAGLTHYAAFAVRDQGDSATLVGNEGDFTYPKPNGFSDLN
jgi:hypothetical protein